VALRDFPRASSVAGLVNEERSHSRRFRHTAEGIAVAWLVIERPAARRTITRDIFIDPRGYAQ